MAMEELISIIVPVYNVELYLEECLNSIRKQTYHNLEIILVNDGSVDNSGEICEKYAREDARFHVIHQTHKGVMAAKKIGIEQVKGSYVGFVDGDDWIVPHMYESLYHMINAVQGQIAISKKYIYDEKIEQGYEENFPLKGGVYSECRSEGLLENLFFNKDYTEPGLPLNLVDKLFRRELILQNYQHVDERLHYFEDIALTLLCMIQAKGIIVCNQPYYYYRQRKGSLCHCTDMAYLEQLTIFYQTIRPCVSKYSGDLLKRLDTYIAERAVYGINSMIGLNLNRGIPFYIPPFEQIPITDRVVLYGAGEIGKSYFRMFDMTRAGQVVLWVDKQYIRLRKEGFLVDGVDSLDKEMFDKILVAVKYQDNAKNIKEELIYRGIQPDKIIWEKPVMMVAGD